MMQTQLRTLLSVVLASLALAAFGPRDEGGAAPVTVFLVRHAETSASTKTHRDPDLSQTGTERAEALARVVEAVPFTHLFASEFQRTQNTLAGVAKRTALEVDVVPAKDLDAQLQALRTLPAGSVALVAGHSNTIPQLCEALGGELAGLEQREPYGLLLPHDQYDRLVLLTLTGDERRASQTLDLRYGAKP